MDKTVGRFGCRRFYQEMNKQFVFFFSLKILKLKKINLFVPFVGESRTCQSAYDFI